MKGNPRRFFLSFIALFGASLIGAYLTKKFGWLGHGVDSDGNIIYTDDDVVEGYVVKVNSDDSISPGYSVLVADTLGFCLSGDSSHSAGKINITNVLGEVVASTTVFELQKQKVESATPWESGLGFDISVKFIIPEGLVSGIYFVANMPSIFFIIKKTPLDSFEVVDESRKKLTILISTNTFNAYSLTAEASLYRHPTMVPKVSFFRTQNKVKASEWLPCLKWVATEEFFSQHFEIDFIADIDMESEKVLDDTSILFVIGHSEYWSRAGRMTFDKFVANGGDALIASGNSMYWQVRYEDNNSTLVSYKNKSKVSDPQRETLLETCKWYHSRLKYPIVESIGASFKYGGYGKFRREEAVGWEGYRIMCEQSPLIKNTGLKNDDIFSFFKLKEYDGAPIIGFDENGYPVPNLEEIAAHKFEILGFDLGYRAGHTVGGMHVMQKTPNSGVVFMFGAKDFSVTFIKKQQKYRDSTEYMKNIFINFLEISRTGSEFFSEKHTQKREVDFAMVTPFKGELDKSFYWLKND